MAVDEFYVTLPSNSSFAYYPNNTLNDFTTKLFKPIDLPGEWEVALTEISFPLTYYNIVEPFNEIRYSGDGSADTLKTIELPPGYYHDLEELFVIVHDRMDDLGKANIKMVLNKNTQKVRVRLKNNAFIVLQPELAAMLGFVDQPSELLTLHILNTKEGDLPVDPSGGLHALYLYTDIIEDQLVGDAYAPLLRIVHTDNRRRGNIDVRTFHSPHFVKVRMNRFDTITVRIRRDTGEKIWFQRGKIVVKLCFRPAKAKYFKR